MPTVATHNNIDERGWLSIQGSSQESTSTSLRDLALDTTSVHPPQPGRRRLAALALPPILLATTYLAYQAATATLGERTGYLAAFGFYWLVWCLAVPVWLIGVDGIGQVFADRRPRLPDRRWFALVILAIPPLGGFATQFLPNIGALDIAVVTVVVAVALVNATLEELLWRGVYVRLFPDDRLRGWLYPAVGFALWHLAPTSVHGDAIVIVAGAVMVGIGFGWIAHRTGSIRWTTVAHILTDATGISFALYVLGR